MIRSFKNKQSRDAYEGKRVRQFQSIQNQIERRLQILDAAGSLVDLRNLPSNHFEALLGDRKGQYSIRINSQWRLCFKWNDNEPYDVEIVDYH